MVSGFIRSFGNVQEEKEVFYEGSTFYVLQ